MKTPLRCHHCDDVIGMYEPMVVLCDGQARDSSRSVEPDGGGLGSECYHRDCFVRVHGERRSG
ncbi:MAG TPA: hypothetical protein VKG38_12910 [Solirubrobacteraceae bacterium]|nr:hypothetical protein [Solirubrobacteraceae bacterium]